MLSRGTVRTGIPGWYIRFDDGSKEQLEDAKHFLRRGLDVTFAINPGSMPSEALLSWDDLRHLIGFAKRYGAEVQIMHHSSTGWSKYLVGDPATFANWNFESYTYQNILDEVDPTEIETELGVPVVGYVNPGDTNPKAWTRHNKELIEQALRAHGFEFAIGLADQTNGAGTLGTGGSMFRNASEYIVDPNASVSALHQIDGIRPGILANPFAFTESGVDLGSRVVTRGTPRGGGGVPLVDPNSGAEGWLLGEDNNGAGAEGELVADTQLVFQQKLARDLGIGAWNGLILHGEARSNAADVALSTGTAVYPRHWSTKHAAWIMWALQEAAHLRILGSKQWAEECVSVFEEGTDIISNPSAAVPMLDIGDESFADLIIPRGLSTDQFGMTALAVGANFITIGTSYDAAGRLITTANSVRVSTLFGPDVPRSPRSGMSGGWIHIPDEDNASLQTVKIQIPHIPPGLYRFDLETIHGGSGAALAIERIGIAASRQLSDVRGLNDSANTVTGLSIPQFCSLDVSEVRRQMSSPTDIAARFSMYFDCDPRRCFPQLTGLATEDPGSIADSATKALGAITVAGAMIGARVRLRANKEVPAGVSLTGLVTSNGAVAATVVNNSGSAWAPGSTKWRAYVEDNARGWDETLDGLAASPWSFSVSMLVSKDGPGEALVGEPRMILLRRY